MKRAYFFFIFFVIVALLQANSDDFSFNLSSGLEIPFGPLSPEGEELYTFGGGISLMGEYAGWNVPYTAPAGLVEYSLIGTTADTSLSLISLGIGPSFNFNPISKLDFTIFIAAGWGLGLYTGEMGGNPLLVARSMLEFEFTPSFHMGLGGTYRYIHNLYNGLAISIATGFSPGVSAAKSRIQLPEIYLEPVFPVFYSFYDENPLGTVLIKNAENGTIENVRISLLAKQYMDSPKLCATVPTLKKDGTLRIPLFALFSKNILSITEGTKASADIIVQYDFKGTELTKTESTTIEMYDRNAMTWDDNRKAASFVTAKDPAVLRFAKHVAGKIRKSENRGINQNFRIGMAIFQSMELYGLNYVIDPKTPYASLSKNKYAMDYLQFPSQTLTYKAGDCDDLSILYAALLKSVGIEVAFLTVPGHIYTAVSLDLPPNEAKKTFQNSDTLIFNGENTWIPVEITMIGNGFLSAWERGSDQWRAAESNRGFYPIDAAWEVYKPVGSPGGDVVDVPSPDTDQLMSVYREELDFFIRREMEGRVQRLEEQIARSENKSRYINRLGVLYARFAFFDEALIEFKKISDTYVPSMINIGNINFQREDMENASSWYRRALERDPESAPALLGLARTNYKAKNYGTVKKVYAQLQTIDPLLAQNYSYLISTSEEGTGRAGSATFQDIPVWAEE